MDHPILAFHGAARGVTGSCFRLRTPAGEILVDCGMVQGSKTEKALNYRAFPFRPAGVAAVLLTHAHIDHSGLLPKLVRDGFRGTIHATPPTADLAGVMLPDSAHIQAFEVEILNRRTAHRHRKDAVDPIYTMADVATCLSLFRPQEYDAWFAVLPGVRARFWNAGHMLGSASVELSLDASAGGPLRIVFSGDVGPDYKLLHPDPEGPAGCDYLVCESTYGDTDRTDATPARRRALLRDVVREAMHPDGALLIPSFAVERTQELLSDLTLLMQEGALPRIPIHVDSPLATRATEVFARHADRLEDGRAFVARLRSRDLHFTETVEQSRALDRLRGFHIVIAASGMCEAGRIRHRLKNWLWRDEATVLLCGYQATGTLGRILQDGASSVRIQGEDYAVRARVRTIDLYSGHADGAELVAWVRARQPVARQTFLVHGEPDAIDALAARLAPVLGAQDVLVPRLDECFALEPQGAVRLADQPAPRIPPEGVARMDWHNDVSRLLLDIGDALREEADEKARAVVIRRLRRALTDD